MRPSTSDLRGGETLRLGQASAGKCSRSRAHLRAHRALARGQRIALVIDAVLADGIRDRAGKLLIPPRIYDLPGYRRTIATLRGARARAVADGPLPAHASASKQPSSSTSATRSARTVRVVRAAGRRRRPTLEQLVAALDAHLGPYPEFVGPSRGHPRSALPPSEVDRAPTRRGTAARWRHSSRADA